MATVIPINIIQFSVSEKPINKNFPLTEYIQQSSSNSYVSEPEETSLTEISDIWQSNSSKLIEITKLVIFFLYAYLLKTIIYNLVNQI